MHKSIGKQAFLNFVGKGINQNPSFLGQVDYRITTKLRILHILDLAIPALGSYHKGTDEIIRAKRCVNLALPMTSCVTLNKLLYLPEPLLAYL